MQECENVVDSRPGAAASLFSYGVGVRDALHTHPCVRPALIQINLNEQDVEQLHDTIFLPGGQTCPETCGDQTLKYRDQSPEHDS